MTINPIISHLRICQKIVIVRKYQNIVLVRKCQKMGTKMSENGYKTVRKWVRKCQKIFRNDLLSLERPNNK